MPSFEGQVFLHLQKEEGLILHFDFHVNKISLTASELTRASYRSGVKQMGIPSRVLHPTLLLISVHNSEECTLLPQSLTYQGVQTLNLNDNNTGAGLTIGTGGVVETFSNNSIRGNAGGDGCAGCSTVGPGN